MAWTAADIPSLKGRVAVVTGANTGLGLETAAGLAGADAHVVMVARNRAKNDAAKSEIVERHPRPLAVVPNPMTEDERINHAKPVLNTSFGKRVAVLSPF